MYICIVTLHWLTSWKPMAGYEEARCIYFSANRNLDLSEYHYPRSQSGKIGPWKRIRKFSCTVSRDVPSRIFCTHLPCAWLFRCHRCRRMGSIRFYRLQKRFYFRGTLRSWSFLRDKKKKKNWEIIHEIGFQLSTKTILEAALVFSRCLHSLIILIFSAFDFLIANQKLSEILREPLLCSIRYARRFIKGLWFPQIYSPFAQWFNIPTKNRNSQKRGWL